MPDHLDRIANKGVRLRAAIAMGMYEGDGVQITDAKPGEPPETQAARQRMREAAATPPISYRGR